ncbi:DNA repair exonuclease SbcCD nuclease subunit [Amphibacillus marinus]|uniref:DNA repair exonuclease SbcCD nuclease subunit n=1 Tax=Amphibacillus marinus TaxID=872970 RepID=A0A1H8RT62_9BACI|nr:DNA repair exonuclease [Amphibacillus marinus]SEO69526.1 DNA repair exonuclease SbcCD nuclease subunit [Amphibacillus marinus]
MSDSIKFIHTADLHLDSPFKGMNTLPAALYDQLKKSTFAVLDRLVKLAIEEAVDFIIIVGDLFDETVQSVYAQIQFLKACQRLEQANIAVYLSYGNHDYRQVNQSLLQYPDNTHLFIQGDVEEKIFKKNEQTIVSIQGFSYLERALLADKTSEFKKHPGATYFIGMLHGSTGQSDHHDRYAPFQLQQLKTKGFDYWALGHIHLRQQLTKEPPIVYPGNTQGRSTKETGEKGCYVVKIDKHEAQLQFKPLHSVRFEQLEIDVSTCNQLDQFYLLLSQTIKTLSCDKVIISIKLCNVSYELEAAYYSGAIAELIEVLNDAVEATQNWCWIRAVELEHKDNESHALLTGQDPFSLELADNFNQIDWLTISSELWQHKQARRFLTELSLEEKLELTEQAKELAFYQLTGIDTDEN